ncbi:MAG: signal peptidase II [Acidobacteria bacterium]|nr:signal peptidase II [Acidobacteriota bacterium]
MNDPELTPRSDQASAQPAGAAKRTYPERPLGSLLTLLAGFAVLAYGLDQLTKLWVTGTMVEGQITHVIPGLLDWIYIRNAGAAFSIGENITWVFALAMAVVAAVILVQARKLGSRWWAIACGMLLGGSLGNLTDRLFRDPYFGMGHVVDFIAFPHFAIFNIADSSIVGSVILICILTLKGIPFGRHRPEPVEETKDA